MKKINIAVDGTAGSGKTATMKMVADKLGYTFVDTGLMYRAFTKYCINQNVNFHNKPEVLEALKTFTYKVKDNKVLVNDIDYTNNLMDIDVLDNINFITVMPEVREKMVKAQQDMAKDPGHILVGRDITTIVLPNAEVKIYLDSSVEARAKRRFKQNEQKGITPNDYDEIYSSIEARDLSDKSREVGPLMIAPGAIVVDNSDLSLEDTVNVIMTIINKQL